jgi:NADPH:quinone reductase-like Zn-dependent oxidoreductase
MKVIEICDKYGVDALQLVERPEPVPGSGQVVLKMKAFSVNYRDLLVVNGVDRWRPPLPRVPLSDGVGIVAATGEGVSRVKVGDRVAPIFYPKWLEGRAAAGKMGQILGGAAADGVLAEYTLFDETSLVHVPAHLTDEEATTLPCAGVTAWNAVISCGHIAPGDSVVVLGTGGVALFALQFARFLGARVIVTSSSDQKLVRANQLGAAAVINYKTRPDWPRAVCKLSERPQS